jgi:hypothetical protein
VVGNALTGYVQFPNPYVIDANTFLHQKSGFGISIGPGSDTQRFLGCLVTWQREFDITLVRQVFATQNHTTNRVVLEKDILADHDVLMKAIYNNNSLSGYAIKTTLISDTGLNFIDGDKMKFLALEMQVLVEYEDTTT